MSVKDTNCDETNVEPEGRGDRQAPDFELPDCCRPMVERMMKAFGSAPENESGAQEGGQDSSLPDWCKSVMAQMMKACGQPQDGEVESADEKPGSCCGEPK